MHVDEFVCLCCLFSLGRWGRRGLFGYVSCLLEFEIFGSQWLLVLDSKSSQEHHTIQKPIRQPCRRQRQATPTPPTAPRRCELRGSGGTVAAVCSRDSAVHQRRDPLLLVLLGSFPNPLFPARMIHSSTSRRLRQTVDQPLLLPSSPLPQPPPWVISGVRLLSLSGISFTWLPSSRPPTPSITSHCIVSSALFPALHLGYKRLCLLASQDVYNISASRHSSEPTYRAGIVEITNGLWSLYCQCGQPNT